MTSPRGTAEKPPLVCSSRQMITIASRIRLSGTRNLLLTGETGVGKDALARWAHSISPLAEGPFVAVNCAAIQESLWESEIFGHARGAYSGAVREKKGWVEAADGGTLFLNEIGDMPPGTQAKLLSFLDSGEFQRVGETDTRCVRARIIAATNRDLEREIERRGFRRDLFYRLAEVHVHIPPLRERPADIPALTNFKLTQAAGARKIDPLPRDERVEGMLARWPWRGNARELFSALETALARCVDRGGDRLEPGDFDPKYHAAAPARPDPPDPPVADSAAESLGGILDDAKMMKAVLDRYRHPSGRWNITQAHRELLDRGEIAIGRRAFAQRIQMLFGESEPD
jgi:transcriptional regulator with GAF, ATPase, and Fis domain